MLNDIKLPDDLKKLNMNDLYLLCDEIRKNIIYNVSKNGGHLSSNLGVVELTVMLHYVFNLPQDKILFDVTHQCYAHKILSGRSLDNLRQIGGVSGFYNKEESDYDCYYSGHSSTSISTALGMAVSRDLMGNKNEIIVVIGDASIANGVAFEGLNNLLSSNSKVIVIVNDNGMSIAKSVGGISKIFNNIKNSKVYQYNKRKYECFFNRGRVRKFIYKCSRIIKNSFKRLVLKENILDNIGIDYLGVVDGHDLDKIKSALEIAKSNDKSIIVHVKTIKGNGCDVVSCDDKGKWHGVGKFDASTFKTQDSKFCINDIICDYLRNNASKFNLCVISPAMKSGSKLDNFFASYPSRSFDVGISEEHAFVFANGMALSGVVPYVSIYSTFMQRSYDFINQDLIRNKSKCIVGVDRVGLVGEDGDSHHGIFDVALVNHLPNVIICMPIYANDVNELLDICFEYDYLSFIRIPKQRCIVNNDDRHIEKFKWGYLYKSGGKKAVLSVGPISHDLVCEIKNRRLDIDVIGVNFIKPIDKELLNEIKDIYDEIYVYDVYSIKEGLFYPILEFYKDCSVNLKFYGLDNKFYKHGKYEDLLKEYKLDVCSFLDCL